jgi:hypothetical protein
MSAVGGETFLIHESSRTSFRSGSFTEPPILFPVPSTETTLSKTHLHFPID